MRKNKVVLRQVFIGIIFIASLPLYGQSSSLPLHKTEKHLGTVDGLTDRHINSTFIDKNQRIWFLSDNKIGLFEFGKVKNYPLSEHFSNRGFNSACEDASGNFWISENYEWYYPFNVQQCIIFNPATKNIQPVEHYIHQRIPIHSVLSNHKHQIFISTKKGELYRFDEKKRSLQKIAAFSNTPLKLLYAGVEGIVVCVEQHSGADRLLLHLSSEGNVIHQHLLKNQFVRSVIEGKNALYYVYLKSNFIALKEIGGRQEKRFPLSGERYLSTVIYDKNKQYFLVNEGRSLRFFDQDFALIRLEKYPFLLHEVVCDAYSNYISATGNGVHILQLNDRKIRTYLKNDDPENLNEHFSCRAILPVDRGKILVNTNKRRRLINLKTGTVTPLHNFKNEKGESFRFVLTALKEPDGSILCGEDALVRTNVRTHKDEVLCNLDSTKIWAIAAYEEGYLLGLEKKGIIYYNRHTHKAKPFAAINYSFENSIIYGFHVYKNDVFIASEAGFFRLINEKTLQKIKFPGADAQQMTCFSLQKSKKAPNELLIATLHGLWVYDMTTRSLRSFITDRNIQSKKYLSAYQTLNGVWASSEEGVWHFDNRGNLLKIITVADGLASNECNRLSHFQDENDVLYFGGINGLSIMNPRDFSPKAEKRFDLSIDSLYTYNGFAQNRTFNMYKQSRISLNTGENSLRLTFSYEDYNYNCNKKYFYRTDRTIRKEWQPLPDRQLLLTNLDYGTTTLELMAVSCDDFIDAKIKKITLHRPNPVYLTWYFWVAMIFAIGMLIWGSITYFTYRLKRRNAFLQQKIDEQTQSLKESLALKDTLLSLLVHDVRYPVQSFYDLSKKLAYLTKKNDHERLFLLGKETENKSRKVLWLIDELVYWVKSTNKNWRPTLIERNLGEIMESIFDTYSEELNEKQLTFTITKPDTRATIDYGLFLILLRNLIFNAIIHAKPQSTIEVSLHKSESNTFEIRLVNPYEANQRLENGLGMGLTLLIPLLETARIRLTKEIQNDLFCISLKF